jgi:medium-chain acyl-[acyl-carrier-protein] hydrolase
MIVSLSALGSQWIVRPRASPTPRLRLFLFPSAGRGPAMFRPWSAHVQADIDLCIVHLPGRETRWHESPLVRMDDLCRRVATEIGATIDRPFALFGHSLGALVAFEVARLLRTSMRLVPRRVIVAGHRAPQLPNRLPRISHLADAEFVAAVRERHGGLPAAMTDHRELMELMLPTLKADYQLAEDYRYTDGDPLPCPISAFGGVADECVADDELASWRHMTSASFVHRTMPDGHFFVDSRRAGLIALMLEDLSLAGD